MTIDPGISRSSIWRVTCLALFLILSVPAMSAQQSDLSMIREELPSLVNMLDAAVRARSALQLAGPLKAANEKTLDNLRLLLGRAKDAEAILKAGPTPEEAVIVAREFGDIISALPKVGLQWHAKDSVPALAASDTLSSHQQPAASIEPAVQEPGSSVVAALASPIGDLSNMEFTYELGVSVVFNRSGGVFQGGCTFGSGAVTSDARIWDVVVSLLSKQMQGFTPVSGGFAQTNGKGVLIVPLITMDPNTQFLIAGRKAYIGRAEQNILAPKFHFSSLSLNEVTDLLQALKTNDVRIQRAFSGARPNITVYQVLAPPNKNLPAASILNSLEEMLLGENPDLITPENLARQLRTRAGTSFELAMANKNSVTIHVETPIEVDYTEPTLTGDDADAVSSFAHRLANLGASGRLTLGASSNGEGPAAELESTAAPKPFVIENECFQISFTPGFQNGGVSPAANFRGRISYDPAHSPFSLKLAAEGETAEGDESRRRIAGSGELTYLSKPFAGGWYMTFGGTGNYSYSQMLGTSVDEWRAGGKLELQTPVQHFFPARGGNDQKPTFTVEAGAIGGSGLASATNSIVRGDFIYTLQPSERMFFDFRMAAGHASDKRFFGRRDFSFGSLVGRFAIYGDWDFVARYQCGRLDPQYIKECGWQTGFGLRTK